MTPSVKDLTESLVNSGWLNDAKALIQPRWPAETKRIDGRHGKRREFVWLAARYYLGLESEETLMCLSVPREAIAHIIRMR